jgi:dinuclear metal center YbgI/SA1388 family protein
MRTNEVAEIIEGFCPPDLQEEWDNSGFQIDLGNVVKKVYVTLEMTYTTVREAIRQRADLVVTHHPMFMEPIDKFSVHNPETERALMLCQAGISVYSAHTSFDICEGGNNDYLGKVLGFNDISFMSEGNRYCRKAEFEEALSLREAARHVADALNTNRGAVRFIGYPGGKVKSVAWCTGAGADHIREAAESGIDLFITGDIKYHQAREAEDYSLSLIDAGHFGTEMIFEDNMADMLRKNLDGIEIVQAQECFDPFWHVNE